MITFMVSEPRSPLPSVWSSPVSTLHFAQVKSFPRQLGPRCATIARARPALLLVRTAHPTISPAERTALSTGGPAYLCASSQGLRRWSGGNAATGGCLSPYSRPASVTRAGSFIISLGPNPCAEGGARSADEIRQAGPKPRRPRTLGLRAWRCSALFL